MANFKKYLKITCYFSYSHYRSFCVYLGFKILPEFHFYTLSMVVFKHGMRTISPHLQMLTL